MLTVIMVVSHSLHTVMLVKHTVCNLCENHFEFRRRNALFYELKTRST